MIDTLIVNCTTFTVHKIHNTAVGTSQLYQYNFEHTRSLKALSIMLAYVVGHIFEKIATND